MSVPQKSIPMNKLLEPSFPTKSEFWGIRCEAGKRYSQVVKKPFHLTMAALDPEVRSQTKPTFVSLMVERGGRQYLLCNLKHDSIVQVNLNLFFDVGERVTFSLKGEATVHLSGYHILSSDMAKENNKAVSKVPGATLNDIDLDDSSDADDVDFEEIIAGEDLETDDEEDSDDDDEEDDDEDDEDDDDDDEEEEEDSDEKEKKVSPKKVQVLKNTPQKRQLEEDDSDEDSSEEEDSDEVIEIVPVTKKEGKKSKKPKLSNTSTPAQNNIAKNTPKKVFEDNLDFDDAPKAKKNPFIDDLNSSIGRTPMPKKSVSFKETPGNKNLKNETPMKKEKQDGQNKSVEATNEQNTPVTPESKKKKKKRRKSKVEMDGTGSPKLNESAPIKTPKKLPGGVECEDLRIGHGLEAKKGKLVHMYYTGKLDNGRVFDSTQPGSKPFSFKLGSGEVIKGLDLATQGMKVGGKRKIRIPPEMGYKNQRMGDIPPSSTLNFVIELKAVS